jgi:hypothetical protein
MRGSRGTVLVVASESAVVGGRDKSRRVESPSLCSLVGPHLVDHSLNPRTRNLIGLAYLPRGSNCTRLRG